MPVETKFQPLYRILFYDENPITEKTWGPSLQALGCQTQFCRKDKAFEEHLHAKSWDVILHSPSNFETVSLDLYRKWHVAQPQTRIWILGHEDFPLSLKGALEKEEYVWLFRGLVTPRDLLGPLQEIPRFREEGREEGHILIAHPDSASCEELLDFLAMEGHRSRCVRYGGEALAEVERDFYHLVLLDSSIQDDVSELVDQFHRSHPNLVVVIMADYHSLEVLLRNMKSDVYDYLLKPFDPFLFRRVIERAIEKQKMSRKIQSLLDVLHYTNHDLVRLNAIKSRFLGIVTHDLRVPLTSIKGYAQALLSQMIPPERYNRSFEIMVKGCEHLEHLIGDLVDFVSIEAGKIRMELKPCSPYDVFAPVLDRFRPSIEKQKIEFIVKGLSKSFPKIMADFQRMAQVFSNLIGNALKHTPPRGMIMVEFAQVKKSLHVCVRDSGVGLSPENLAHVFDQFFQVSSSENRQGGLGLGLTISKEIIRRHGGNIGVTSPGLNQGTTFWFTLPLLKEIQKAVDKEGNKTASTASN